MKTKYPLSIMIVFYLSFTATSAKAGPAAQSQVVLGGFHLAYTGVNSIGVTGPGTVLAELAAHGSPNPAPPAYDSFGNVQTSFVVTNPNGQYGLDKNVYTTASAASDGCYGSASAHQNPSLSPNTVYYLYYSSVFFTHYSNEYIILATTEAPDISDHLAPFPNNVGLVTWAPAATYPYGPTCIPVTVGTFIGSFITDSSANLVPFVRAGDEVILSYQNSGIQRPPVAGGPVQIVETLGAQGIQLPNGLHFAIPGALVPSSASAIVVDINVQNYVGSQFSFTFAAGGANEVFNSFNTSRSFYVPPGPGYAAAYHVLLSPDGLGKILAIANGSCPASGPCLSATFSYQGYIENVRAPSLSGN